MSNPIIAVVGPTASGKTGLAISLAELFAGEIISCDSMQIYKGMDIGTAKPTPEECARVPHHMIGIIEPSEAFSVSDYVYLAEQKITEVNNRNKIPFVVGGTGLYARSLLYGIEFNDNSRDDKLRVLLMQQAEEGNILDLYEQLKFLDPIAAESIHINNTKRVIRALEYCIVTGDKFSSQCDIEKAKAHEFYMLGINYRNRETLYNRINLRVDQMIEEGLIEEAKEYYNNPLKGTSVQAIGYKELFPYFDGFCSLEEAVENIKRETRRYAKRQLTWFRREKQISWIYPDDYSSYGERVDAAVKMINESKILSQKN